MFSVSQGCAWLGADSIESGGSSFSEKLLLLVIKYDYSYFLVSFVTGGSLRW